MALSDDPSVSPTAPQVRVGPTVVFGGPGPLPIIAGPCVIESAEHCLRMAERIGAICGELGLPLVFKASFDKANRTSLSSFRGPGLERGLEILAAVKARTGLPVTTDIHHPEQAAAAAEVVDLLQIPAFLARQTDLICAAAETGRPVNLKKAQFMAPADMGPAVEKARASGAGGVLVTERGTAFGYRDLVVDLRSLPQLAELGVPVVYDATHSVQQPGGEGRASGGQRRFVDPLARAAVAAGVSAVFLEVHDAPERAPSDAAVQLPLDRLLGLLRVLAALHALVGG